MSDGRSYFKQNELLAPPMQRAAYSDRMAYVLAEMSGLAYFPFEGVDALVTDAAQDLVKLADFKDIKKIEDFLSRFADRMYRDKGANLQSFEEILDQAGFALIHPFDRGATQGFLCCRNVENEPPYLVLAFRGTEKKVEDWLTDAHAIPKQKDGYRVHSGFYNAFGLVQEEIYEALKDERCFSEEGKRFPLYITGHSLGGALAIMATKYLARDVEGACYTYGAPRVADYEFFFNIKTPVYRVVNSSDLVPRVPPGAGIQLGIGTLRLLGYFCSAIVPLKKLIEEMEQGLDRLKGYRHHGDLRYLTDVQGGRFSEVRLVYNPPGIDRLRWFGRHLKASLKKPIESHSMSLYRKKLIEVAKHA